MTSSLETYEKKLHSSVINFLDDLITILPNETLIGLAKIYISIQIKPDKLMRKFKKNIIPISTLIKSRSESFFIESKFIDVLLNKYNINLNFRDIWKKISPANKKIMWAWSDKFLELTEKYVELEKSIQVSKAKTLLQF